eukprot:TRINITY_DN4852_c0_g2_i3.p1 TRINITY_DN4852_c0_g2~~TRINITY_DN4852_c0_g2_i3.p1  ORF type:complete len:212 (+),score=22.11 TRINITY_DN4852_c0_g2_i3:112-747(+)
MALWVVGTIMFLVGLLFVLERGWSYAITQSYFQLKKTKEQEYLVGTLKKIFVYPVKGCSPISVSEWRITSSGLVYDRFWCVAIRSRQSREFSCLSPTEYPSVVLIKPSFTGEMLHLDIPGMETLQITRRITTQKYTHSVRVHGNQKTTGIDEGIIAADWLTLPPSTITSSRCNSTKSTSPLPPKSTSCSSRIPSFPSSSCSYCHLVIFCDT